jgi:ABC-type multidrug transport system ATPase subunit
MQEPILQAYEVHKRRGGRHILRGANLRVDSGRVIGICGENGCGKTTLLLILVGLLAADRGRVTRRRTLGYAPQVLLLYDQLTPREHFRYFAAARGIEPAVCAERANRLFQFFAFEQWADRRVATLSEGTKQKLNLGLALLSEPSLLLLDEPYAGLEWETYLRFWEYVDRMRDRGRAIVIVSHLFHDRTRLDSLLELREGVLEEAG